MKTFTFNISKTKGIKGILIGLFISEVVLTILLSVMAVIMSNTGILNNTVLEIALTVICGASTFIGSFVASKIIGENGLINGFICGFAFFVLILISGMIMMDNTFSLYTFFKLISSLLFGIIGGIIGVNKKEKLIK